MPARSPRTTLTATRLEDRTVPALWGTPWPEADSLSFSFANDGTKIGNVDSRLYDELGKDGSQIAAWKKEILGAFQSWLSVTNVNLAPMSDSGKPFEAAGPLQGSDLYGDIRLGAKPLSASEIGTAVPFDQLGARAGDIILNSDKAFTRTGEAGKYDLRTVLFQEAGHALGVGNSTDPASVMYTDYTGKKTALSVGDITNIQAIYGARRHDRFDAAAANNTRETAAALTLVTDGNQVATGDPFGGAAPYAAAGDITSATDVDFYKVTIPSGQNDFRVELRTSDVSMLTATVSVYKPDGSHYKTMTASDPLKGDISMSVSGVKPGEVWTVKVVANTATPFTVGAYKLAVGKEAGKAVFPAAPSGWVNPDNDANNGVATASTFGTQSYTGDGRWEGATRASIESDTDRDFYKLTMGSALASDNLVVSGWATEIEKLDPVFRVWNANGTRVASEIISDDASSYAVQVRGVRPGATYYIEVAAADPQSSYKEGNYFLAVDLRSTPVELQTLGTGTLSDATSQEQYSVTASGNHVYYFGTAGAAGSPDVAFRTTIYNAVGQAVATYRTDAESSAGLSVRLPAGTYTVKVSAAHRTGQAFTAAYTLGGVVRDDAIGPQLADGSTAPIGTRTTVRVQATKIAVAPAVDSFSDPFVGV